MYFVKINDYDDYLYYPGDARYALGNIRLKLALNDAGVLEFDIYSNHPHFDHLEVRKTMVSFYRDDALLFTGEVREIEADMKNIQHIYCVGELTFLYDTIQPQAEFPSSTITTFVTALLQNHNDQVALDTDSTRKTIQLGNITVTADTTTRYTNFNTTHAALVDELIKPLECYMRIRKADDGSCLLDIIQLEDYGTEATQTIRLGENLLDFSQSLTADDVITALIPLGKKKEDVERTADDIASLDAYIDIKQVNGGKNYLYLPQAVANFGWVCAVKRWEDAFIPYNIMKKGQAYLESGQYANLSLCLTAIDLSDLNSDFDSFHLGDTVRVVAEPYGLDRWFPVTEIEIQPLKPDSNKLTLGSSSASLTKLSTNLGGIRTTTESSIVEYTADPNFQNYVTTNTYTTFRSDIESDYTPEQVTIVSNWQGSISNFTDNEQGEIPPCTYSLTYIITTLTGKIHCFLPFLGVYEEYFSSVEANIWHKFLLYEEAGAASGSTHSAMEGPGTYTMPVTIGLPTYVNPLGQLDLNLSTRNIYETLYKQWFVEAGFPSTANRLLLQFLSDPDQSDPTEAVVTVIANRRLKTRRWHPNGPSAGSYITKTNEGLTLGNGGNLWIRIPISQDINTAYVQIDIKKIDPATYVGNFDIRMNDGNGYRTLLTLKPEDLTEDYQTITVPVEGVKRRGEIISTSYFDMYISNGIEYVAIRNFHFYGDRYAYENTDYKETWGW